MALQVEGSFYRVTVHQRIAMQRGKGARERATQEMQRCGLWDDGDSPISQPAAAAFTPNSLEHLRVPSQRPCYHASGRARQQAQQRPEDRE